MPRDDFRPAELRDSSPESVYLTMEAMGIEVDRYAGHPALDLIAHDVKAGLESGLSPTSDVLRAIEDYVDFHGTGDKVLDTLQVVEHLEVIESDEVYHRVPEGFDADAYDDPWAAMAAAAILSEDLGYGFDGTIEAFPMMDCIDYGKLADSLADRGCGAFDADGWVSCDGKRYETAEGALASCGIAEQRDEIDSEMGVEVGDASVARAYIEGRLSFDGLDDLLDSSSAESIAVLAYALTMVSDEEAHGIELYCAAPGRDIDGAGGLACVTATMAKLGAEEFGYMPCRGLDQARHQFCSYNRNLVTRDELMETVDLERLGQKFASVSILLDEGWAETRDPDYPYGEIDLTADFEPDYDTHPRERSILWSRTDPVISEDVSAGLDLGSADGWRGLVQAVKDELADRGDMAPWPSCWGEQARIDWLDDGRGVWAPLGALREVCGGEWAAEAWSAVAHGDMTPQEAADAWSRGDFTAFEMESDLHGAWAPAAYTTYPKDIDDYDLKRLAGLRPDLFDDKSCAEYPLLAQAREAVGNLWIVGDGDATMALTDELAKVYFENEPDLADMREAGSGWRDWISDLERCDMCSNAYGPSMREQERAAAAERAEAADARATPERAGRPAPHGIDH